MGLFTSVLHFRHTAQEQVVQAMIAELKERQSFASFTSLDVLPDQLLADEVFTGTGAFYIITQPHGDWITLIEVAVNTESPVFLYEFANKLSERLQTYVLSFHLHDGDVVYYNLEHGGQSLDGYQSDCQYFLEEKAGPEYIIGQRHDPRHFAAILPTGKTVQGLNEILDQGYWNAFDNKDLDEEGTPNDDKYYIDEESRLVDIGMYLEIFNDTEYPFANWYEHADRLEQGTYYVLHANE